jgi:hypothetical protein
MKMESMIKSMINDRLNSPILFLLNSVAVPNNEEESTEKNFLQKFFDKKKDKTVVESVSLASLVRDDSFLFN